MTIGALRDLYLFSIRQFKHAIFERRITVGQRRGGNRALRLGDGGAAAGRGGAGVPSGEVSR